MLGEEGRERGSGNWRGFKIFFICVLLLYGLSLFGLGICNIFSVDYGKFMECEGQMRRLGFLLFTDLIGWLCGFYSA
ncbi:hypothetical protein PCORN_12622 [Listeria cornellensis FSL F6-0969]|uniref:Uncharacterized protein n=1 Tax=Listeria cornellensis FSL F6-0969 TaxID=1265820 RepID=W7BMH2_9LIST|nr:hypothetical protein PCORN_12622 [Listeria cornellensis FSL F6-0969]